MRKALMLLFLLVPIALSANVTVGITPSGTQFILQGGSKGISVNVTNIGSEPANYTLRIYTPQSKGTVGGKSSLEYTITNLAAGSSIQKSATFKMFTNQSFGASTYVGAQARLPDGDSETEYINFKVPKMVDATIEYEFKPVSSANSIKLAANAVLETGETSKYVNGTYAFHDENGICASGNMSKGIATVDVTNCAKVRLDDCGPVPVNCTVEYGAESYATLLTLSANVTSHPDWSFGATAERIYLVRSIGINASLFAEEDFGFLRPFSEIDSIKGNTTIHMEGTVLYDTGKAVGQFQDDSENVVGIKVYKGSTNYVEKEAYANSDGSFRTSFTAPANTSLYTVSIKAVGKYGLATTITKELDVSNKFSYTEGLESPSDYVSNLAIVSVNNGDALSLGVSETAEVPVLVSNSNLMRMRGGISVAEPGPHKRFIIGEMPSQDVEMNSTKNYTFRITPEMMVKPGTYTLIARFDTNYGSVEKQFRASVREVPFPAGEVSIRRYADFGPVSRITLKVVNNEGIRQKVTVIEGISKALIPDLKPYEGFVKSGFNYALISDRLGACNATVPGAQTNGTNGTAANATADAEVYLCQSGVITDSRACDWCSTKIANAAYAALCAEECEPYPINFSKPPRIVEYDPTVAWDLELAPGEAIELSYSILGNAKEHGMAEPEFVAVAAEQPPGTGATVPPAENATAPGENGTENWTPPPERGNGGISLDSVMGLLLILILLLCFALFLIAATVAFLEREAITGFLKGKRGIVIKIGGVERRIKLPSKKRPAPRPSKPKLKDGGIDTMDAIGKAMRES